MDDAHPSCAILKPKPEELSLLTHRVPHVFQNGGFQLVPDRLRRNMHIFTEDWFYLRDGGSLPQNTQHHKIRNDKRTGLAKLPSCRLGNRVQCVSLLAYICPMPLADGVYLSNACSYWRMFVQCRSLSAYSCPMTVTIDVYLSNACHYRRIVV